MKAYLNPQLPLTERVQDLLSRMTLREKVGQLNQRMLGWNAWRRTGKTLELTDKFQREVEWGGGMGALYGLFRADPWSKVDFANGIRAKESAGIANKIQRYVRENTRLGIPVLMSEECAHGHLALEGTVFPTNLGMGSTWNPELCEEVAGCVAAEVRSRGAHLALVSALDMLVDPRWGRAEECHSEDPYLSSQMAEALVRGLQGRDRAELRGADRVVAVLKHFCAQGAGEGGRNTAPAVVGERELREIHFAAMAAGAKAGALGCMAAYNEIDGVKCHANEHLLTGVLRGEMGFEGFVMADGYGLEHLEQMAGSAEEAAGLALRAGVDLSLWDGVYTKIEDSVRLDKVSPQLIDRAVERILRVKFHLGLFENPYTDEKIASRLFSHNFARETNLRAARESLVLLKNEGALLPFSKSCLRTVSVIGPNSDSIYNQLGDYTAPQPDGAGWTIRRGIEAIACPEIEILHSHGCGIRDGDTSGIAEAVGMARNSDAVVLVLGGSSARNFDSKFDATGAADLSHGVNEMNCGEGADMASLELEGSQLQLADEVLATGRPVVLVLIQGRPHAIPTLADRCSAILCGWYPGTEGGLAIAEALFGRVNPSGKLPVSIPRSSGQIPVYYNHKASMDRKYIDLEGAPQYPFGHGLSYTEFHYSNIAIETGGRSTADILEGGKVNVSVDVENIGRLEGAEVVQLYLNDLHGSVTTRVKMLRGFRKIFLRPGERRRVYFELGTAELGLWDATMKFTVEPGKFRVMAGGSSNHAVDSFFELPSGGRGLI